MAKKKDASNIAKNIVRERSNKKITRVDELVKIIEKVKKKDIRKKLIKHKNFSGFKNICKQRDLGTYLWNYKCHKVLKPGGKILTVSFHSIEDKIIKYFLVILLAIDQSPQDIYQDDNSGSLELFENYYNKVIKPSKFEIDKNYPSRSAKLRFAIRSKNKFVFPNNLIQKFNKLLKIEAMNVQN